HLPCRMRHTFFSSASATTGFYTLSLHDALPIYPQLFKCAVLLDPVIFTPGLQIFIKTTERLRFNGFNALAKKTAVRRMHWPDRQDRKSTRLNSSHVKISYAVFCLKKKKKTHGVA